jgi:hypothetical protein
MLSCRVLEPTLAKYVRTVDLSSEAACRAAADLVLIECIAALVSITASFLAVLT